MKNKEKNNFTKLTRKKGISLIVLIITVISTYNETIKNIQVPPKNRIKIKLINSDKVTDFKVCCFF